MTTYLSDRERQILDLLSDDYGISVSRISEITGVSAVTIRNDLNSLEEKGTILRTRGGAVAAFHPDILKARKSRVEEKARIAKAAAGMIEDGDTLMINDGTTASAILRHLLGRRDLQVVTNNTLTLPYARTNPSLGLTIVGGNFRPSSESMVGPLSQDQLGRHHVRMAFVGTDGFSMEKGLTTHFIEGAEIIKAMRRQSERLVVTADSSKYGRSGFVTILPLDEVDMIITDNGLGDGEAERLEEAGIEVLRV